MKSRRNRNKDDGMLVRKKYAQKLFNGNYAFEVPYFQRRYIWQEYQWDRFLEDMERISKSENRDYFMGFIVLKSLKRPNAYSIIDGQQRLTTFFIFAKVMCEINEDNEEKITFEDDDDYTIFEHNYVDQPIFKAILESYPPEEPIAKEFQNVYGKNQVLKCYNHFNKEEQKCRIENIDFGKVLKHLFFVCMFLTDDDDEQEIFDTMNSLGISLTTSELLKNYLFNKGQSELFEDTWLETFEKGEEDKNYWDRPAVTGRLPRSHIDLLLQSVLSIKESELSDHKSYQKHNTIFKRYKYILENHYNDKIRKKEFINELIDYAKIYREHIQPDSLNESIDGSYTTQKLSLLIFSLEITPVIPYIIFILKKVEEKERERMFKLIETYLMRRVICGETNKNYNKFFAGLIGDDKANYSFLADTIYNSDEPSSRMPNDEQLEHAFSNRQFTGKMNIPKTILYFLEYHLRTTNHSMELRVYNDYNVEHIMPKKWQEHWKYNLPEDTDEPEETRNNLILMLGNLTLLTRGLNSSVRNFAWKDKLKGRGKKRGFEYYCKDVATLFEYLDGEDWNEETIRERGQKLLKLAKKLWAYGR